MENELTLKKKRNYRFKANFGVDAQDKFGFNGGYFKNTKNESRVLFIKKQGDWFTGKQEVEIISAMRQDRLTGKELNPMQPIPYSRGHEYSLVKEFSDWANCKGCLYIYPWMLYCLTNKEMVLHAPEIVDELKNSAIGYYAEFQRHSGIYNSDQYKKSILEINNALCDINTIFKAIGEDEISDILSDGYYNNSEEFDKNLQFQNVEATSNPQAIDYAMANVLGFRLNINPAEENTK